MASPVYDTSNEGGKTQNSSTEIENSCTLSVSHITVVKLDADETSMVQGHLGFINFGSDEKVSANTKKPGSHLWLAVIVSMVVPLVGIPAIVLALKSKKCATNGRIAEAQKFSKHSLSLSLTGLFLTGVILVVVYSVILFQYRHELANVSTTTPWAPSSGTVDSVWENYYQHQLPYRRYHGSIYDINYDVFNRYL